MQSLYILFFEDNSGVKDNWPLLALHISKLFMGLKTSARNHTLYAFASVFINDSKTFFNNS